MGLFSFLFGNKKDKTPKNDNKVVAKDSITASGEQYIKAAKDNSDICDGVIFSATLQLRTPLWILQKNGEIYTGDGEPPQYGNMENGCWTPHLKNDDLDFLDDEYNPASDAMGSVTEQEYLNYAIGLLTIFEQNTNIHEKMTRASKYAKNKKFKKVEQYLLQSYGNKNNSDTFSIIDVMSRFISDDERFEYFSDKENYLYLVSGVNKTIEKSLLENEIKTINDLKKLTVDDLVKLKGVGKISANKIIKSIEKQH